jgi:hypothetical protein
LVGEKGIVDFPRNQNGLVVDGNGDTALRDSVVDLDQNFSK